jgi:hypothetical protein
MQNNQKFILIRDRLQLYKDFSFCLFYKILDYYLDPITLSAKEDIENHFNFCYDKTCNDFEKEEKYFKSNDSLRMYFYAYFFNQLYKAAQIPTIQYFEKFWNNIFDLDINKNKNMLGALVEIYQIFDTSLNKEKNLVNV